VSKIDIYGIGAALVDTEIEVSDTDLSDLGIEKGVMTLVDENRQHELLDKLSDHLVHSKLASGGSAANSIIAANALGAQCFYSCRVAKDDHGQFYLKDLKEGGVEYPQAAGTHAGITGKCLVFITPDAERSMNTFLGISEQICAEDIDLDALQAARFAYIEGYLVTSATGRPAAIKVREQAKKSGVSVALSLSDPAIVKFFKDGIVEMIGDGVDLLFCNEAEAMAYTDTNSLQDACEALQQVSTQFAVTRGSKGARLFDGTQYIDVSGEAVKTLDTNGAGDMFAGAFLASLTRGKDFKAAGELACRAAAKVVSQYGPRLRADQYADLLD
jgi:sugar/nucleoside kinase (ribokinase family)